jgi:hypothetical protein
VSILAAVFIATKKEALIYNAQSPNYERLELPGLTDIELSTLWALIQEKEFDFDKHELGELDTDAGALMFSFPKRFIADLAGLGEARISSVTTQWAESEEMQWPTVQAQEVLIALISLAKTALAQSKGMFLWISG